MKRCPLCDFIYEDDQGRCDMDGLELIPEQGTAPLREEASARPAQSRKSRRRRFAALPFAGVILATVLFPAYYVSTRRAAPQKAEPPPLKSLKAAAESPAPYAPPADAVKATDGAAARTEPAPNPSSSPRQEAKKSERRAERRPEPKRARDKKDSTLGSILKKTGRMLKKPFKL